MILYYQIAEQYITLEVGNAETVRRALDKYENFLVPKPKEKVPLLSVKLGQEIESVKSDDKLLERASEPYFESQIYRRAGGHFLLVISSGKCTVSSEISADWRESRISITGENLFYSYLLDRHIMIAYTMATLPLGYLKMHASVTELGGRALLFLGVSGTGKSTHSRLWREYVPGSTLLNDDEPIVRLMPDASVRVYGCPWSGSTPCYRNEFAEVVAFVHLYQSPDNKLTLLRGRFAFESIYSSTAVLLTDREIQISSFNTLADVLNCIPVYRLDCRPDREAVSLTRALLD